MAGSKMYGELAPYYDLVYSYKDYRKEASLLRAIARREGRSRGRALLDVGCGTGRHLEHLRRWYDCTGLDASPAMLRVARKRLPQVRFVRGRMETFSTPRRFDVITCLFGAVGYTMTLPNMRRAVTNLAAHLQPGGVLLVAPFCTPRQWRGSGFVRAERGNEPGVAVARVTLSFRRGRRIAGFTAHYLIGRGSGIRHVVEEQTLGLFEDREVQQALREAGLRTRRIQKLQGSANGLHIGVKPLR